MELFLDAASRPLVAMWSETDFGEEGYGYFGVAMLQSPAVDENNFLRSDVEPADFRSQIGLTTVRNWGIRSDQISPRERYDFMSADVIEGNSVAQGGRLLFSSGSFNLRPGETARYVIGYFFAPSVGDQPDGSEADVANLIDEVNKATQTWTGQAVSVNRQPAPAPFRVQLSPNPVNNVLSIQAAAIPGVVMAQFNTVQIEIIDQTGRVVLTQAVDLDPLAGLQYGLDLSALNAGNYFCRLQMGEYMQSQSFVVMR